VLRSRADAAPLIRDNVGRVLAHIETQVFPTFLIGDDWQPDSYALTYGPFLEAATPSRCRILVVAAVPETTAETRLNDFPSVFDTLGLYPDRGELVRSLWA
jgi:hypothetical protein